MYLDKLSRYKVYYRYWPALQLSNIYFHIYIYVCVNYLQRLVSDFGRRLVLTWQRSNCRHSTEQKPYSVRFGKTNKICNIASDGKVDETISFNVTLVKD